MLQRDLTEETIVAVSTPPGEGGVGIVRLSGERALAIAGALFQAKSGKNIQSQKSFTARYGCVVEKASSGDPAVVDEALLLVMRAPKSYTGEDVAEFSTHGGQAILQAVVKLALEAGARLAEPGEFTKRAYLNGRLDLLQAEAVLDLIQAKTERTRRWASSQLEGVLSGKMKSWKEVLVGVLSHLEASVDFPDDFPETDSVEKIQLCLLALLEELQKMLRDSELTFTAKRGFKIVLWGRPNVGKSSLLNRLTRSNRVIVTPYPGTTRDVVEEECSLGGFPVRFQDTAGIHDTENPIEKEGVKRSKKAMAEADLVILTMDGSEALHPADEDLIRELEGRAVLVAVNKSDLPQRLDRLKLASRLNAPWPVLSCSCVQERGTEALESAVLRLLTQGRIEIPQEALVSTARQKDLLEKVSKDLTRAQEACSENFSPELIAADIRQALDHLGALVGEVVTEDMLEVLFRQFCIGK